MTKCGIHNSEDGKVKTQNVTSSDFCFCFFGKVFGQKEQKISKKIKQLFSTDSLVFFQFLKICIFLGAFITTCIILTFEKSYLEGKYWYSDSRTASAVPAVVSPLPNCRFWTFSTQFHSIKTPQKFINFNFFTDLPIYQALHTIRQGVIIRLSAASWMEICNKCRPRISATLRCLINGGGRLLIFDFLNSQDRLLIFEKFRRCKYDQVRYS